MRLHWKIASAALGIVLSSVGVPGAQGKPENDADAAKALAAAHSAANGDPLLEALLTELERSKDKLKMDQVAAPYYIEYRVSDVQEFIAEAAFGASCAWGITSKTATTAKEPGRRQFCRWTTIQSHCAGKYGSRRIKRTKRLDKP